MLDVKSFDPRRAVLEDYLNGYPAALQVSQTEPLQSQHLPPDERLLTFEYDQQLYAVPMSLVLSYNVVQGEGWMMTFCNACNTGMVFDPTLDGQTLHFQRRGSYDGLLLIWDQETDSYWQHISGQCLHGGSVGKQLRILTTTREMKASEVAAKHAEAQLVLSTLSDEQHKLSRMMEKMRANPERVEAGIIATIAQEDTRRPRFELGLGVWNGTGSTFFPLMLLYNHNNALITRFDNRPLLIYQTPEATAPVAAFLETERVWWEGDVLRLDGGASIRDDLYYSADGETQPLEMPNQLLMRWYGFALTFPGCDLPEMSAI